MPVQFQCSECRTRLSTARRKIRSTVTCPKCKSAITVPCVDSPEDTSQATPSSLLQKGSRFGLLNSRKLIASLAIAGGVAGILSLSLYGQKKDVNQRDVSIRNIDIEESGLSERFESKTKDIEIAAVPEIASVPEVVVGIGTEVNGEELAVNNPTNLVANDLTSEVQCEPARHEIANHMDGSENAFEEKIEQQVAKSVEESTGYFNIQETEVRPLELAELSSLYNGYPRSSVRGLIMAGAEEEKKAWDQGKVFAWDELQKAKATSKYSQAKAPIKFRRYITRSEEDLNNRLAGVPEIDRNISQMIAARDETISKQLKTGPDRKMVEERLRELTSEPAYAGLPFAVERNRYQKKNMEDLKHAAKGYRNMLLCFDNPIENRFRDLEEISINALVSNKATRALRQIWMGDEKLPTRLLMVEFMSVMDSRESSEALAKQAIFDFDDKVREQAVLALRDRPEEHYRDILLSGFRYPYSPVAEHAAEAVVNLGMESVVSTLREYLDSPNPNVSISSGPQYIAREIVKINHFGNCNVCHAPSYDRSNSSRAPVARVGEVVPATYYDDPSAKNNVRFDTVFLQQDFSREERVKNPGMWPEVQRFDYLVRTRKVDRNEVIPNSSSEKEYMDAILFALQELAQEDPAKLIAERNAKRTEKSIAFSTRVGD